MFKIDEIIIIERKFEFFETRAAKGEFEVFFNAENDGVCCFSLARLVFCIATSENGNRLFRKQRSE